MTLFYRQFLCTKLTLFIWMVSCFVFCGSSLNATNSGGNDTIASSAKSSISINEQKLLIRNMTAEQLTAFIDETFDMDTIPLDIINEINWAAAKLEKKDNSFENVVIETPAELGDDTKNRILEFVKNKFNKTPELEVRLVPELIGGFIVEVEGLLIDLSVSGQLAKVRKALVQNQRVL